MTVKQVIVAVCILLILEVPSRHLFFGEIWAGKTTLINKACGAHEPVANPGTGQIGSTTKQVKGVACGDTEAVDTIGVFDYDEDAALRIGTAEVQATLLENAEAHGLSSVLFTWPSLKRVGNAELEGIFMTLRRLLPEVPMAIINIQFPGYVSHVPMQYHKKFQLPLLDVTEDNVSAVQDWMKQHKALVRISLPKGWRDILKKFDVEHLRQELLSATLMSCTTVRDQLNVISTKIKDTPQPVENCECGGCDTCKQDCRREERYCCNRILGFCESHCTNKWIDEGCQRQVTSCHDTCGRQVQACFETCKAAHNALVAQTQEQLSALNSAFKDISTSNKDLLETCDRFRISDMSKHEL